MFLSARTDTINFWKYWLLIYAPHCRCWHLNCILGLPTTEGSPITLGLSSPAKPALMLYDPLSMTMLGPLGAEPNLDGFHIWNEENIVVWCGWDTLERQKCFISKFYALCVFFSWETPLEYLLYSFSFATTAIKVITHWDPFTFFAENEELLVIILQLWHLIECQPMDRSCG